MGATAAILRRRLESGPQLVVPGAANALTARVIEEAGFDAVYVTGAGIANTFLGAPDIGLVTLSEVRQHVEAMADAVGLPLIVDADTGFGNPLNVARTVRTLEKAGAAAIQLEDQVSPKKCGHFAGKRVIPAGEMVQKIHAAVDARVDESVCIIARTDARVVEGFDSALERAAAYREAGADVLFVEAPQSLDELRTVPSKVPGPHIANLVEGGKTPLRSADELSEFAIVLFANIALQAAVKGMQSVLADVRRTGSIADLGERIAPWAERQRMVRKPAFDEAEQRYSAVSDENTVEVR
ncbi:carboxyvinyl-carboxyphosphonate phosphorylmutase [Amycolatopsis sp. A1MSW2902]|uniref:isocitrate lyase/PEP mutase family protein n=1 Tax=Amycolatopsis sp. A1MSW2902 TaxID=687413 RepID=UPI00307E2A1C